MKNWFSPFVNPLLALVAIFLYLNYMFRSISRPRQLSAVSIAPNNASVMQSLVREQTVELESVGKQLLTKAPNLEYFKVISYSE